MKNFTKTILCVDDDVDDFHMLQEALNGVEEPLDIVCAKDGIHALELLEQMKENDRLPCLIVLDINMPRMNGKQTIAAIQADASLHTIPLVLFTTSSSEIDKSFSLSKHVELISKPLNVKTLQAIATKLIRYCNGHLMAEAICLNARPLQEIK
jgi:CheY-like chemotaxis protein